MAQAFEVPAPSLADRVADAFRALVLRFRAVLAEAEELERQGASPGPNGLSDWEVFEGVRAIFPTDTEARCIGAG